MLFFKPKAKVETRTLETGKLKDDKQCFLEGLALILPVSCVSVMTVDLEDLGGAEITSSRLLPRRTLFYSTLEINLEFG